MYFAILMQPEALKHFASFFFAVRNAEGENDIYSTQRYEDSQTV